MKVKLGPFTAKQGFIGGVLLVALGIALTDSIPSASIFVGAVAMAVYGFQRVNEMDPLP